MLSKSVGDLSSSDLLGYTRTHNDSSKIKYSGYLLKRSNNPWKESSTLGKAISNTAKNSFSKDSVHNDGPNQIGKSKHGAFATTNFFIPSMTNFATTTASTATATNRLIPPPSLISPGVIGETISGSTYYEPDSMIHLEKDFLNNGNAVSNISFPELQADVENLKLEESKSKEFNRLQFSEILDEKEKEGNKTLDTSEKNNHVHHAVENLSSFFGISSSTTTMEQDNIEIMKSNDEEESLSSDILERSISAQQQITLNSSSESSHIPPISKAYTQPIAIAPSESDEIQYDPYHHHPSTSQQQQHFSPVQNVSRPPAFVRMTSAPIVGAAKIYPPPPSDYIDSKDGHIWRAKYCVLEDRVLYFYPDATVGNSDEARMERERMSGHGYSNNNATTGQFQFSNSPPNDNYHPSNRNNKRNMYNRQHDSDHLAKSPMPRHLHTQKWLYDNKNSDRSAETFNQEPGVFWEKRVSLNMVGKIKSNPDYGERVFELLAINSDEDRDRSGESLDRLLLRAANDHEMNRWIFEIHMSFISMMKQIAEIVVSSGSNATAQLHGGIISHLAPRHASPLTPVLGESPLTETLIKCGITELSHGHGRNLRRRKELEEIAKNALVKNTLSLPADEYENIDDDIKMRSQSFDILDMPTSTGTLSVKKNATENKSILGNTIDALPVELKSGSDKALSTAKKYVPPHLRKAKNNGNGVDSSLQHQSKKYIPPRMRNVQNILSDSSEIAALQAQIKSEDEEVSNFAFDEEAEMSKEGDKVDHETISLSTETTNTFLGGCADPSLITGSICDPQYKEEKSSKVETSSNDPYQYKGNNIEIGAVSVCGIRGANEDSFLILNDLLDTPTIDTTKSYFKRFNERSLFAIFDGHGGNHASRYVAEKFHERLLYESTKIIDVNDIEEDHQLQHILNATIARLDKEFCELCTADGREWYSGTTAIVSLVLDHKLFVANVGDCQGIFCCSSDVFVHDWKRLDKDDYDDNNYPQYGGNVDNSSNIIWKDVAQTHSPLDDTEGIRIKAANGWVTEEQELTMVSQFHKIKEHLVHDADVESLFLRWFSKQSNEEHNKLLRIGRVCGDLSVSRAIGDREYKAAYGKGPLERWESEAFFPYPNNQIVHFNGDLVVSTPDFNCFEVGSCGDENVLLLACDGLWDVLDGKDIVLMIRKLIFERGLSARDSAKRLAVLAEHLGSSDNITVIIVRFFGSKT